MGGGHLGFLPPQQRLLASRLAEVLPRTPELHSLTFINAGLGPAGISTLAAALPRTAVKRFTVRKDNVDTASMRALGTAIRHAKELRELTIQGCKLDDDALQALAEGIRDAPDQVRWMVGFIFSLSASSNATFSGD